MKKRIVLSLILLVTIAFLSGCAVDEQSEPTDSVMAEYCSNEAVDNYYRQNSEYAEKLTEAWKKRDEKSFDKARSDLIKVCDAFIAVTAVPDEVKDMHNHMVTIATKEKSYAYLLSIDDYEGAGKVLDDINREVEKAKGYLA